MNIIFSGFREREVLKALAKLEKSEGEASGGSAGIFPGGRRGNDAPDFRRAPERRRVLLFRHSASVFHVRIVPEGTALSPRIPPGCADLILSREPWDALRVLAYLKKDGAVRCGDSGGLSRRAAESFRERCALDREAGCDRKKCWEFLRRRVGNLEAAGENVL